MTSKRELKKFLAFQSFTYKKHHIYYLEKAEWWSVSASTWMFDAKLIKGKPYDIIPTSYLGDEYALLDS